MAVHKWRRRPTKYFGEVSVPFAYIQVQAEDGRFRDLALQVDSGAVVSLLRRSFAEFLGLELESGRPVELSSVGGGSSTAYVHDLRTRFDDNIEHLVPFAISTRESVPNLLGRLGVFDRLQVNFDATLSETHVRTRWLNDNLASTYKFFLEMESWILERWPTTLLPEPADEVALLFQRRAAQVSAAVVALMKNGAAFEAPLVIRTLFELSSQFAYLMLDPVNRATEFLDYGKVSRFKLAEKATRHSTGPIGKQVAESPLRERGEIRNKEEYEQVKKQFQRSRKDPDHLWDCWHCMSTYDLAKAIEWEAEYGTWWVQATAWTHSDPFAMQRVSPFPGFENPALLIFCCVFYGRMLKRIADAKQIILLPRHDEVLKQFEKNLG